jgi:2-phospho-L-lactate guanylyltransferase
VRAITEAIGRNGCRVIGGDRPVQQTVAGAGGMWCEDRSTGLNATVLDGMVQAFRVGMKAAVFIPADVPLITPDDVLAVIDASDHYSRPAGVEASADGGTNALLVPAGAGLVPALGPGSYLRHRLDAERAGFVLAAAPAAGLLFDVDWPADLAYASTSIDRFSSELSEWEERLARDSGLLDPTASRFRALTTPKV